MFLRVECAACRCSKTARSARCDSISSARSGGSVAICSVASASVEALACVATESRASTSLPSDAALRTAPRAKYVSAAACARSAHVSPRAAHREAALPRENAPSASLTFARRLLTSGLVASIARASASTATDHPCSSSASAAFEESRRCIAPTPHDASFLEEVKQSETKRSNRAPSVSFPREFSLVRIRSRRFAVRSTSRSRQRWVVWNTQESSPSPSSCFSSFSSSKRTRSKIGSRTLWYASNQNPGEKRSPWKSRMSKSTSSAERRISARASKVRSERPFRSGNQ
mmetsp:Transcript_9337/g.39235  ORF Transcript_9337/g.39235 Transcript_9337/m.39235 type:complete len:287 (-) Transcript_9337:5149-6009(-)